MQKACDQAAPTFFRKKFSTAGRRLRRKFPNAPVQFTDSGGVPEQFDFFSSGYTGGRRPARVNTTARMIPTTNRIQAMLTAVPATPMKPSTPAIKAIIRIVAAHPRTDSLVLGLLWKRATSFGMILAVGFLLLVSLVVTALLSAFESQIDQLIPSDGVRMVMWVANGLFSFGMITLLFAMIYKILPDAKIAWRDVWFGAVVTAVLFIAGKELIGLYLVRSSTASAFGAAGSFMVFLIWIFFSVQILFFGAELTQVYANRFGSGVVPIKEARRKRKKADPENDS